MWAPKKGACPTCGPEEASRKKWYLRWHLRKSRNLEGQGGKSKAWRKKQDIWETKGFIKAEAERVELGVGSREGELLVKDKTKTQAVGCDQFYEGSDRLFRKCLENGVDKSQWANKEISGQQGDDGLDQSDGVEWRKFERHWTSLRTEEIHLVIGCGLNERVKVTGDTQICHQHMRIIHIFKTSQQLINFFIKYDNCIGATFSQRPLYFFSPANYQAKHVSWTVVASAFSLFILRRWSHCYPPLPPFHLPYFSFPKSP